MAESDEEFRQAARRAVRRQLTILLPMVLLIGLVMAGVDAALGHTTLALAWGGCFVVAVGTGSVFLLRR